MYNWIENVIGVVPIGSEWIYSVSTIIMYIIFACMLCAPIIIIINLVKIRKR